MINTIEGTKISNMCDYSFGDQASIICNVYSGFMKPANRTNIEFLDKVKEIYKTRNYMTVYIDNIRLYKRSIIVSNDSDQIWINNLMNESDLLNLCGSIPEMKFIVFTGNEDTPIDRYIEGMIPDNVLSINAVNAIYRNSKINPMPYGLQRKMDIEDDRLNIFNEYLYKEIEIINLLYVNHNIRTNLNERSGINELFENKPWATVNSNRIDYQTFLSKIKQHKFVICPIGNAIDCHRNWEVLYMGRVPVMKKNDYLQDLFKHFPVLFIDDYSNITDELLLDNNSLFESALIIDYSKLNLDVVFQEIIKNNIL